MRNLTAVETDARFYPTADPRVTYHGEGVVQARERGCSQVGCPKTIQVDHGRQLISRAVDLWAYANDVTLHFLRPGNGVIEAFSRKQRSECLSAHWIISPAGGLDKRETWCRHYNEDRPHSAIGPKFTIALHYSGGVASLSP